MMKDLNLLVWLTQLGLGVAVPMAGFVYLGIWLRSSFGLGTWVVLCCLGAGLVCAVSSLRSALKTMARMTKPPPEEPPVSFNTHE